MEGALASVIGGLTPAPVVAVPTSTGYGAALEGITALETMYRDALAGSADERLNTDRDVLPIAPRAAAAALDACRDARQAIAEFNPNETLLVERLLLHLPAAGGGREPLRGR